MKTISLILSVYKKERELEILLNALRRQSYDGFEVIIADDGSGEAIERLVNEFQKNANYKIQYLTQEDKGFRKNRILNKAVCASKSEYLIFLDGDCIPHKDFVKAHYENLEAGTVLTGRRVHLNKSLSDNLTKEIVIQDDFDKYYLRAIGKSMILKNRTTTAEEGIVVKSKAIRRLIGNKTNHIVGCNFSLPKELLLRINGFDENYTGPGIGEDTDIEHRLRLLNVQFKSVRNLAVVFHMYHHKTKENSINYEYFHSKVKLSKNYYCQNGINKS